MHPLETTIDESFHRNKVERRRSSLDNSCLATSPTAVALIEEDDKAELLRKGRRLSLGTKLEGSNTTFLAVTKNREVKMDLDATRHDSYHNTTRFKPSNHSKSSSHTINTSYSSNAQVVVEAEEDDDDDDFAAPDSDDEGSMDEDDDSDCDSFCDASVDEPANPHYIRADLGASAMWSDDSVDNLNFQDSWGAASEGSFSSFRRVDAPPGKPRRTRSGSAAGVFRTLSEAAAASSSSPIKERPPMRHYSAGSATPLGGRRHMSLMVMDQILGPE